MRPTIAWHCTKRWTPEDDRVLSSHIAQLREEVAEAGGLAAWLETRLAPSLGRRDAPCPTPRLHALRPSRRQPA